MEMKIETDQGSLELNLEQALSLCRFLNECFAQETKEEWPFLMARWEFKYV